MKLARREKLTIAIGLIIVLAVLGRQLLQRDPSVANADAETLAGALQTIDTYDGLRRQIERLQEDLGVEAPVVSIAGQEAAIRTDLSERAKKLGLKLAGMRQVETGSGRARSGRVRTVEFRLDLNGQFEGLMKLVHSLEHAKIPYIVREMKVEAGAKGAGGAQRGGDQNKQKKPDGNVSVTMRVQSYLFPKVFLSEVEEKPKTDSGPAPQGQPQPHDETPQATPAQAASQPTSDTQAAVTPTPSPATTPATEDSPGKTGRLIIKMHGQTIIFDRTNRTVTVNGETHELTDEQFEQAEEQLENLPADAEVIEE